jgi:hypothetical protein
MTAAPLGARWRRGKPYPMSGTRRGLSAHRAAAARANTPVFERAWEDERRTRAAMQKAHHDKRRAERRLNSG